MINGNRQLAILETLLVVANHKRQYAKGKKIKRTLFFGGLSEKCSSVKGKIRILVRVFE
jgi:hypothetical protein